MQSVMSETTRKLSRNLKITAAIAVLYFAFGNQVGGGLEIFNAKIPAPAVSLAVGMLVAYHSLYLLLHWIDDNIQSNYELSIGIREEKSRENALIYDLLSNKSVYDQFAHLSGLDGDAINETELGRVMTLARQQGDEKLNQKVSNLERLRRDIDLKEMGHNRSVQLSLLGHVVPPVLFGLIGAAVALFPEMISWVGDALSSDKFESACRFGCDYSLFLPSLGTNP